MNDTPAGAGLGSDAILARLMGLHPKIIDLTLERMWRLLARLGHPERALPPVVHIAGTNGKGSTAAMIRAGLEAQGERVHVYTSPHLVRFHERIRLAGRLIAEPALEAALAECEAANGGAPITYFEITTCAAFLAFARTPAEWCLLEVGLGGRLDATNVVDRPALSVITPVSYDHQQYLGETIEEIAAEKAGILKPGVPAVIAPQLPAAQAVIAARAGAVGAPMLCAGREGTVRATDSGIAFDTPAWGEIALPAPALPGAHQIENAGTALLALATLCPDLAGDPAPVARAAMTGARWPGRLQRLNGPGPVGTGVDAPRLDASGVDASGVDRSGVDRSGLGDTGLEGAGLDGTGLDGAGLDGAGLTDALAQGVALWLDGGHNPAAGEAIAAHFAARPGRLWVIAGMLDTKDNAGFARPIAPLAAGAWTVDVPNQPAGMPAVALAAAFGAGGMAAQPAAGVHAALAAAGAQAAPGDDVLICGSLYLAGHVLALAGVRSAD
ncbi:MAG: folylpolyglutamate synthase/dihydrofolate synthase family protein [Pseudomonadota bacterium]